MVGFWCVSCRIYVIQKGEIIDNQEAIDFTGVEVTTRNYIK
jgi:hypothetical protein